MSDIKIKDVLKEYMKHCFISTKRNLSDKREYTIMFSYQDSSIIPTDVIGDGIRDCLRLFNKHNINEINLSTAELIGELFSKEKRECKPEDIEKFHTIIGFDGMTFYHCKSYGIDKDSTFVYFKKTDYPTVRQAVKNNCNYKGMDITERGTAQAYIDGLKAVLKNKQLLIIFCSALSGLVNEFIGHTDESMILDISAVSNLDREAIQNLILSVFGEPNSLCKFPKNSTFQHKKYIPTTLGGDALGEKDLIKHLSQIIFDNERGYDKIQSPIFICSDSELSSRADYYEKVLTLNPKISRPVRDAIISFTQENQSVFVNEIAKYLIDNNLVKETLEEKLKNIIDSFIACYNNRYNTNYERGSGKKILELSGMILLCADILSGVLNTELDIDDLQSELMEIVSSQIGEGIYEAFEDIKRIIRDSKLKIEKVTEYFEPKGTSKIGYKLDNENLILFITSNSLRESKMNLVFDKRKEVLKSNDCLRTSGNKFTYQDTKRGRYYYIKVPKIFKDEILKELNTRTQEKEEN